MKNWLLIGFGFISAMFVMGCWLIIHAVLSNEEVASLTEWSDIQAIAVQHRDKPIERIEIEKIDGYSFVGIPVRDARKQVWIMLNPRNPPLYKQGPSGNYTLSKEEFKTILASNVVSSSVANCLESHLEVP